VGWLSFYEMVFNNTEQGNTQIEKTEEDFQIKEFINTL